MLPYVYVSQVSSEGKERCRLLSCFFHSTQELQAKAGQFASWRCFLLRNDHHHPTADWEPRGVGAASLFESTSCTESPLEPTPTYSSTEGQSRATQKLESAGFNRGQHRARVIRRT